MLSRFLCHTSPLLYSLALQSTTWLDSAPIGRHAYLGMCQPILSTQSCWSCSRCCIWYFFISYCTPSSFITLHSYGTHTTYFGILLLHHHYTFSYDASGIHSSFLAYINSLCLACITSVVYLLRLR